MSPFGRPPFSPSGRLEVRRELRMGNRVYGPGEAMAASDRDTLTARQIATLWQQGMIDTLPDDPSDAELERLTAPAAPAHRAQQPKQQAAGARR